MPGKTSPASPARWRCPACDFPVYNRRLRRCERCGLDLPESVGYSPAELAMIAAEEARIERIRLELERAREEEARRREERRGSGG